MTITKEDVIDMAWQTEGLVKLMEEKGDSRAATLKKAQLKALEQGDLSLKELELTYKVMEVFAEEYKFDSEKRKYAN